MKKIIIQLILGTIGILAFEVNTHQAITRCALTQECSQSGGVSNLENFVKHTELNNTDAIYQNEDFDKYESKYVDYVGKDETGFEDWNISITPNYLGMIEAGSVLEDSVYHNHSNAGDGRFNNHFYSVQFDSKSVCSFLYSQGSYMLTDKTLCGGYGLRTDNIDWVFNKDVNLGQDRVNDYGIEDAFKYFKQSFEGDENNRTMNQAKLFITLGMMSHMLQDLHSPAHVRDGSHVAGDYLEMYGRYDKGFNLRQGNMNHTNEQEIENAISSFDMPSYMSGMNFKSLEDFYYKEAEWVSNNFFSEEHNVFESSNTQTGFGLTVNNYSDRDTIFDLYNDHLAQDETFEVPQVDESGNWSYIKTYGNSTPIYGDIMEGHDTVAFNNKGFLFTSLDDNEHMIKAKYTLEYDSNLNEYRIDEYTEADVTPLKDTAVNVIPRAVASTQGFLNFFFRGQIGVTPIYSGGIDIYNDSPIMAGLPRELTRLKAGGKFYLYYMNEDDNISYPIRVDDNDKEIPYVLEADLEINQYKRLYLSNVLDSTKIDAETKIFVIYDGEIGDENLGGNNTYEYGMRGMTADVAFHRLERIERDSGDDTVIDYAQNIEWQDINLPAQDAWYGADRNCTHLNYAGLSDWKLPTKRNLLSIIKTRGDSYIYKKYFKNMIGEDGNQGLVGYWSSDFHTDTASVVSFNSGLPSEIPISSSMNIMCIRSIY